MSRYYDTVNIPVNPIFPEGTRLLLVASNNKMRGIYVEGQKHAPEISNTWERRSEDPLLNDAAKQLLAYFSGEQKQLKIPYMLDGTPFQQKIWRRLTTIPYGKRMSYKALARDFATPQPVRPLASAIAKNPLLFLVPCHRIIGSNGNLRGFSAGLEVKKRILELEKGQHMYSV